MDALQIGSRREVCWDEALIDTSTGVKVQMHRPEYKGVALELGELWEGNASGGYGCLLQVNGTFRLYYRGLSFPTASITPATPLFGAWPRARTARPLPVRP